MIDQNSNQSSFEKFMTEIERVKKTGGVDLSIAEDLSLAVMNLISLEEHFFFTALKTGQDYYLDTMAEIRDQRRDLLATLLPNHEGETWCAAKHLLAATMRQIEVGNKFQTAQEPAEAKKMFERAYRTYVIFWALKLKLVEVSVNPTADQPDKKRLEDLVAELANCCDE